MALVAGLRPLRLQSVSLPTSTSTSNPIIDLDVLPAKHRLHSIMLNAVYTTTQPAAAATAHTAAMQTRLLAGAKIGKRHRSTGTLLRFMGRLLRGADFCAPATNPATNDGVYSKAMRWVVPFGDDQAADASDTMVNTELLKDQPLELDIAAPLTLLTGAAAFSGTLQPIALVEAIPEKEHLAIPIEINYSDFSGGTAKITRKARSYSHIILFKETGAAVTSAEVTSVTLRVDGETVYDRLTVDQLAALYNFRQGHASSNAIAGDGTTASQPGALVNDQPAVTTGAGTGISVDFVPIYVPGPGYKHAGLLFAQENVQIDIEGTLTSGSWRVGWRAVETQTLDQSERAAVKVFGKRPKDFLNATLNGNPLSNARVALLTKKKPVW